jgi:translation initiation factor 4G
MQKAIAILNKLSVETFDKLSDQFLNIGMETEAIMCRVVDLIVSKAQMEEHFCFMYADLCKKITEKWVSEDLTEDTQQPSPEEAAATSGLPDLGKAFRLRLLTRCQEEFQQDREAAIQAVLALEIPEDEKEEKLFVLKKRYTGHMRFIGEIYMKDLLKPSRVLSSIEELLNSRDEEKLSCLMKLLQTVGKKLEAYDVKKKKNRVMKYFEAIQQMSTDNSLSTKIRFGFKDLMEMRANNWTARRVEEKAKKLSEIRASSGVGSGPVSSGSQGPSSGTQMRGGPGSASSRHPQVNDARAMPAAAPAAAPGADDWSVVTGARNKKGGSSSRTPAGPARGAVLSKPTPTPTTNKFGALANQSAQSQRTGGKSKTRSPRDDDDEETSGPQVQIPQSSSLSAFSPNGESTLGEEMLMSPTAARGADGVFDEAMTTRVRPLDPPPLLPTSPANSLLSRSSPQ